MSHINSGALSDDGKFSTRALRHYAEQENEPAVENHVRFNRGNDGLSTYVETSDKGSRRHLFNQNEERIDEVEEDGSDRTSPPGTIGEVHDYMSENIKSNVVNKI
jgi:hypothetical protein